MNVEPSVIARARIYAALADPVRLSIVDMLRLQDLSPGEIGARLALPTNLVAHHVGILARDGLVRRVRSEGDRRRIYLRLTGAAPADPHVGSSLEAKRVVFVCTRNSARSQLAAALWAKASQVPALSAGTQPAPAVSELAMSAARRHGIAMRPSVPRHVAAVARHQDLLVAVCDSAHETLPETMLARLHWSVPDPVPAGTAAAFDTAIADLSLRIAHLAPVLASARRKA